MTPGRSLRRGKRAGISARVDEIPGGWLIAVLAHGRGPYTAFLPRCACEFDHAARKGGYHAEHVGPFVGRVLASYGCTSRRTFGGAAA